MVFGGMFGGTPPKPLAPEWPKNAVTREQVVELVATTFKNRERRLIQQAYEAATVEASSRVLAHLRGRRLLDDVPLHITEGFD